MEKAKDICVKCGRVITKDEQSSVVNNSLVCLDCDRKSVEAKNALKEREHHTPKKRTCIWAKISFFSALSCWMILFLFILVSNRFGEIIEKYIVFIFIVLPVIAFVSGILSLMRIKTKKDILKGRLLAIGGLCLSFLFSLGFILPPTCSIKPTANRIGCASNMAGLGQAIHFYAQDNNGRYPTPSRWCDLLVKYVDIDEEQFVCKGALKSGDKGRCHYALNPNCAKDSPEDTVLLFESKGGWNQFGGPELLNNKHHESCACGCNILFNDTHVEFIFTKNLSELKWDNKPKDSLKQ